MPDVTISIHYDLFGGLWTTSPEYSSHIYFLVSFASLSVLFDGREVFNSSISPRLNLI